MVQGGKLFLTVLLVLLLSGTLLPSISFKSDLTSLDSQVQPQVSLLAATDREVSYEIWVPWEQLILEPITVNGIEYMRVSLPGWLLTEQAGAPVLPFLAEKLGAPHGVDVSVQAIPGKAHTIELPAPVLPAASTSVNWEPPVDFTGDPGLPSLSHPVEEDAALYRSQAAYPVSLAKAANDGILRQQRVLSILAFPIQYHPNVQKLVVFETLTVKVTFEGKPASLSQAPFIESAVYESLFQDELLNYEQARAWRQVETSPAPELDSESNTQGSNTFTEHWVPPSPGWRLKVRQDGFYKLTYAELRTADLPVDDLVPSTFQLFHLGNEVAITVFGEADNSFDSNDYILFYGQAISSKYTADNVYWLTYGSATGLRMSTRNGTPDAAEMPVYYREQLRAEDSAYYLPSAPGDDDLERWFWDYIYPSSKPNWTHNFSLTAPYTGTANLTIALLGYLDKSTNPDHHVTVSLNGTQVSDLWFDGLTWQILEIEVPDGILKAGSNTLTVTCPNDTGLGYDLVYVDRMALEYNNTFRAEANELAFNFTTAGTWKYQVDGFSNDQIVVYEVNNPHAAVIINNVAVAPYGLDYVASFQDTVGAPTHYWAMATGAYRKVQIIEEDTASNLGSTANATDYILITHEDFKKEATALTIFRDTQIRAMQVDLQDVYDEFDYGITSVGAIHDFLAYAYANWQAPRPVYVLLVGDGNYDPKNYLGYGRESYMPPFLAMVDPWLGETAADNRYVTVSGTDLMPDMMLGRLSVNSPAETSAFINKILGYEQNPPPGNWQQQVLTVTDNTDSAGNFAQTSDDLLACCLPSYYQATKVYYGTTHTTVDAARSAIQAGINAGKLIVNYIGHGYYSGWAQEDLLTTTDVDSLTNGGKLPVVLAMTCREGYYQSPDPIANNQEAVGEVITRADGRGAIASWSPTGLGVASGHDILNRGFYDAIFKDGRRTLGQATNNGKFDIWSNASHLELLDTYLLFGDPATDMNLAENYYLYVPAIHQRFTP